jgi:DNA-directed RNA polymerase specialized sigma24 family protein
MFRMEGVLTVASPSPVDHERTGETAMFDERFAAIRPRLVALCTGLAGAIAAEDIVQDTYLRGRERLGQLRDQAALEAWLARIAVNGAFNYQRHRRRWLNWLPDNAMPRLPSVPDRDPGLRELLELLPARERTIIVLHHGYGYELAEIAQLLSLSHTNVRTIIRRTRLRLAAQLKEAGQ